MAHTWRMLQHLLLAEGDDEKCPDGWAVGMRQPGTSLCMLGYCIHWVTVFATLSLPIPLPPPQLPWDTLHAVYSLSTIIAQCAAPAPSTSPAAKEEQFPLHRLLLGSGSTGASQQLQGLLLGPVTLSPVCRWVVGAADHKRLLISGAQLEPRGAGNSQPWK